MYQITPTQFFYPLSVLYHESGLEVTPSQEAPEGTLALWRCDDLEDGSLLGAATLQMRAGHHVLAHLAVAEPARGQGLGAELLAVAEAQAVRLGAKELWLVGKVPDFYRQFHWVEVPQHYAQSAAPMRTLKESRSAFPAERLSFSFDTIFVFRPLACTLTGASCGPGVGPG